MTQDDYGYYAIRAQEEDEAARRAASSAARGRHEELAGAYRFRCELIRGLFPSTTPEPSRKAEARQRTGTSPAPVASSAGTNAAAIA